MRYYFQVGTCIYQTQVFTAEEAIYSCSTEKEAIYGVIFTTLLVTSCESRIT